MAEIVVDSAAGSGSVPALETEAVSVIVPAASMLVPTTMTTDADAPALTALINLAFQVERFFLDGDRLDLAEVLDRLRKGLFMIEEADGRTIACVYVELRGDRAYLGLLSVDPMLQGAGLGKRLVAAAEDFARAAGCRDMDLNVVNLREELPLDLPNFDDCRDL